MEHNHLFTDNETLNIIAECLGEDGRAILRTMPRPVVIGFVGGRSPIAMDWEQLLDCIRRDCFAEKQRDVKGRDHRFHLVREGGLKPGQAGVILAELNDDEIVPFSVMVCARKSLVGR